MINPLLGDARLETLQTALTGLARRQQLIAGNIANVDTPGYQRQDVDFESGLRASLSTGNGTRLATTEPGHMAVAPSGGSLLRGTSAQGAGPNHAGRNDDNNVDIDYEMTHLAETQLRYELLTQATSSRFGTLRDIATRLT